ncbi:MAG: cupredoxin domain-containing protein [Methanobacteriota archaeon]
MRTRLRAIATVLALLLAASILGPLAPRGAAVALTFVVEMENFLFVPNVLRVDPGDVVTIVVFNNDTTGHTFDIVEFNVHLGSRSAPMVPGENRSATFTADLEGTFWFFCDIPEHATRQGTGYAGMAGRLIVGTPTDGGDLTFAIVGVGVAVAGGIVGGVILWMRRRRQKP